MFIARGFETPHDPTALLHLVLVPVYQRVWALFDGFLSVSVAGDNSVDLFTHDLGLVVITNEAGELQV